MGLLPDVHVNLDQPSFEQVYQRAYQIFLPLIPGLTLMGGLMLAHPHSAYDLAAALGLGRYSRVAVFLCGVYVAGLVLYGFSNAITLICSMRLTQIVGKRYGPQRPLKRPNDAQTKAALWRRVAAEFLGNLKPPVGQGVLATAGNDDEWEGFYNILQDYLLLRVPVLSNEAVLFFTHLQATAWALLYLYWSTAIRGHWSVLVVSITLIVYGATFPFFANFVYWKYDRLTVWDFTARLIREIKTQKSGSVPPSGQI